MAPGAYWRRRARSIREGPAMSGDDIRLPQVLPILSRGKHRSPRKGACFMEMASFLAGERWSDHPSCTHPVLAAPARCVNTMPDDTSRQRIGRMIPEVVGLNPHDDRVAAALVLS